MPTYDNPYVTQLSAQAGRSRKRSTNSASVLRQLLAMQQEQGASPVETASGVPRASRGIGRPTPNVSGKGGSTLERFINAIVGQESGGRYNALGVPTHGSRAYGRYQIMGYNIPSWSKEALGRSVSPEEFLRSPQIQDAVARAKLTQYFKTYGLEGAAKAWYGGPGSAKRNSEKKVYGGPSLNQYARDIMRRMGL